MRYSKMTIVGSTLLFSLTACGGGTDTSPATAAPTPSATATVPTPATPGTPTTSTPVTPTGSVSGPTTPPPNVAPNTLIVFSSPLLATDDTIGTVSIPTEAVTRFAAAISALTDAEKSSDATKYPLAGNQRFLAFTSYTRDSAELASFGYPNAFGSNNSIKFVFGSFRSPTAARLFPCLFGDRPLSLINGECNFTSTQPDPWEGSTTPGSLRVRSLYLVGGPAIQQQVSY